MNILKLDINPEEFVQEYEPWPDDRVEAIRAGKDNKNEVEAFIGVCTIKDAESWETIRTYTHQVGDGIVKKGYPEYIDIHTDTHDFKDRYREYKEQ